MTRRIKIVVFLVAFVVAMGFLYGCGGSSAPQKAPSQAIPAHLIRVPPQSAVRPDSYTPERPPLKLPKLIGPAIHISDNGVRFIAGFEGFESCPYWDAYGHVWTRGFGETEGIGPHSPCISYTYGLGHLRDLIESRYQWAIRGLGVNFNQNQIDALDSFVWNLGAGIFTGSLRTNIQHYNPYPILQYNHAGGVVLEGLSRRRREEVKLFLTPVAPPKPVPHSELVRRLRFHENNRLLLRNLILIHQCAIGDHRHATPIGYRKTCNTWIRKGKDEVAKIKYYNHIGIY